MNPRPITACAIALFFGCAAPNPALPRGAPIVSADVYTRFQLDRSGSTPTAEPVGPRLAAGPGASAAPPSAAEIPILGTPTEGSAGQPRTPLQLEEVVESVERQFPLIQAALEEVEIAAGRIEGANGAFDTKLTSKNRFDTEGFYENDRYDVGFEQPTPWLGSVFSGGYRLGEGDFAVYDGKAKTNKDGEFRFGVEVPLLRGNRIDANRVAVWQARIDQELAEPTILAKRLAATSKAAIAYWKWVARGEKLRIARGQLDLALDREEQLETAVDEGQLAPVNLIENKRLIVERQANLAKAERGLEAAAIALSLFLRDGDGDPVVASVERLPARFPAPRDPDQIVVPDDAQLALSQRPEVRAAQLELAKFELDRDLARNSQLAGLDLGLFASQDVGDAANTPDDKDPFELELRVQFELPLQRRKALGKEREVSGKITKLERELRFIQDQVVAEVQDIVSALQQSYRRVNQAAENVRLAGELESAERLRMRLGESDLFRVNLREQQSASAASSLVDVLAEYFQALAAYRAAIGVPYDEVMAGLPIGATHGP